MVLLNPLIFTFPRNKTIPQANINITTVRMAADLIFAERQQALAHIRSEIAAGNHSWVDHWRESRGEERAQADDACSSSTETRSSTPSAAVRNAPAPAA